MKRLAILVALVSAFVTVAASAAQLSVGCPDSHFTTIQSAVNAASPGDTIHICKGTYVEQVTINKSVALQGEDDAVIKAPSPMTGPIQFQNIVMITGAGTNASVQHLTISGPGPGPCGSIDYGIFVGGGANADISHNHITEIGDNPLGGCQNGGAVRFGSKALGHVATGNVSHNLIDKYQKGGIVVDNTGSNVEVDHNTVAGVGRTSLIAQNGIQISRGAVAHVHHNDVSGNSYSGATVDHKNAESVGILLFQAGNGVVVDHNSMSKNDDGMDISETNNSAVSHNDSNSNALDGIFIEGPAIGSALSVGNTLDQNQMKKNFLFDAEDMSSPNNTWTKNKCSTSSPAGLCK